MKAGPQQDYARLLTKPRGGGQQFSLYIHGNEACVRMDNGSGDQWAGGGHVGDNKWHHIAGTFDHEEQSLVLYLDGNKMDWATNTGQPVEGDGLYFGRFSDQTEQHFSGILSETRIWNFAMGETEIQSLMHSTLSGTQKGLVAYYTYDPISAPNVMDLTTNGNNGTCHNGAKQEERVS